MYNVEIKQRFLDELCKTSNLNIKAQTMMFDNLENLERKHRTDAYDIPYDILLRQIMRMCDYAHYSSLYDRYVDLRRYKTWALKCNLISENAKAFVDEKCNVKQVYIENCKTHVFKTPGRLLWWLDRKLPVQDVPENISPNNILTVHEMTKALCMLIYNGIKADDALALTVDNVRITKNNTAIITDDEIIIVYPEFEAAIQKLATCRQYYIISGRTKHLRDLDNMLFSNGVSDNHTRLRNAYITILINRDTEIKFQDLYYLGKIYSYVSTHAYEKKFKRGDIMDYCFGGIDKLSKRHKEQFYRMLDLWEYHR